MVSPMSRKAHFVALLLPFAAAVNYLLLHMPDLNRRRSWNRILAAALMAFIIFNLTSRDIVGKTASVYLLALSVFFFATLALWLVFIMTLARERPRNPDRAPSRPSSSI
jgi:hypothetical protein